MDWCITRVMFGVTSMPRLFLSGVRYMLRLPRLQAVRKNVLGLCIAMLFLLKILIFLILLPRLHSSHLLFHFFIALTAGRTNGVLNSTGEPLSAALASSWFKPWVGFVEKLPYPSKPIFAFQIPSRSC